MKQWTWFFLCVAGIGIAGIAFPSIDFSSLSSLSRAFDNIKDDVQPGASESWLDPDYSKYYRGLFGRPYASTIANMLANIVSRKNFGAIDREQILRSIRSFDQRPYQKLQKDRGVTFSRLSVEPGDEVIVFGDVHGAFSSFLRTLQRFFQAGLINDSLKIQKPRLFFVFLGDYLNRSPYGFHLLMLLFHFAGCNPEQVFLLRGRQESDGYWENFLASRDFLKTMFNINDESKLPLAMEINNVFERLPEALILEHKDTQEQIVCAHAKIPSQTLAKPLVQAFLCGEKRQSVWRNSGLSFQDFMDGTALWRLFSAPVPLYVRYGGLDRDAHCVLPIGESIARGVIGCRYGTRPTENVSSLSIDGEMSEEWYSIAYGHRLETEKDRLILASSRPYYLCSSGDLSATLRRTTRGCKQGLEACFLDANQNGGSHGFLFRVVFLDDEYTPLKMVENVKVLRERYKTDALLVPQGSAPIQQLMPQIRSGKFFVFFPYTGGAAFRKPDIVSMIHIRQPYFDETVGLLEHFQDQYHARKIALVYQNDAFGKPIVEHLQKHMEKRYPKTKLDLIPFTRGQLSMQQQLESLKKINPEAIGFFITNPAQISTIVTDLGINNFVGKHIFALAFEEFFVEVAERWGVRAMFSSSFQPPRLHQGALMEEFYHCMRRYYYPVSIPAYEAFFGGKLFLEGFNRAKNPGANTQEILTAIEKMSGELFYGQLLTFNPKTRGFVLPVWVFEEDGSITSLPGVFA